MTRYNVTLSKAARIYGKRREPGETVEVDEKIYNQLQFFKAVANAEKAKEFIEAEFTEVEAVKSLSDYTRDEIVALNAKEQRELIEKHQINVEKYKSLKAPELETALLKALGFESGE